MAWTVSSVHSPTTTLQPGQRRPSPLVVKSTLALAVGLLLGFQVGCSRPAPAPESAAAHDTGGPGGAGPLVLIVVDTLRADHLSCYGYWRATSPRLCELAADGVLFERAYTPRTSTTPAIASMLTGLYPHRHGVRRLLLLLPDDLNTLAERMRTAGYATGGFVSSFVMVADVSGLAQGFDVYDDDVREREPSRENYERPAAATVERAIDWLAAHGPRAFLLVHLIEPHGPYTPPEPFLDEFALPAQGRHIPRSLVPAYQILPGVDFVSQYVGRYDGEIASADAQIGRLIARLKQLGWYDGATIVAVADHGESMGERRSWFRHGTTIDLAQAHVPLIVKFAGSGASALRGRHVAAPVTTVDVFPTMLAAADIEQSATAADGRDAAVATDLRAIVDGRARDPLPPLTELKDARGLIVAGRASDCEIWWKFDRGVEGQLATAASAASWRSFARSKRFPRSATPSCETQLASAASPLIIDMLTYKLPFPVVSRKDFRQRDRRTRFIAERAERTVPLGQRERDALRSLGYVE